MKRVIIVALLTLSAFLASCSAPKAEDNALQKQKGLVKVLSTTAMIDALVFKIGGDRIEHAVLITGEIDPHGYELVKGDDEKVSDADLVFFNGLNLEHGASLRYKLANHPASISLGEYILKHYEEEVLFEQDQPDPHIWMDISLWTHAIDPILEALVSKDPEGKPYYLQRAHAARNELVHAHQEVRARLQKVPSSLRYLVTSHDAFGYFTRAYLASDEEKEEGTWKLRMAAPEGFAPDGQLAAADLQKIINYLVKNQVHVIFPESNVSPDSLRKIIFACKEKNIDVHLSSEALYGDSMGPKGTPAGNYPGMIEYDADVLIQQWER